MNLADGEKSDVENSWCIAELKSCPDLRLNLLTPTNIILDYVKAHNVELRVRAGKRTAKISLNGVPKFLVDAFAWLENNDAYRVDGIFRKEGNANRLKNAWAIYCGLSPIHEDCNAHDVCSLIKRFFREIKTPIFTENQMIILRFAESLRDSILIDAILSVIERLPSSHISTITFLMKQLKRVSEYSGENHMNIENLATVFAPSLFRDETVFNQSVKKKRDMQFRLMNFVRSRNGLQILVIKSLIENAHLLGSAYKHEQYQLSEDKVLEENTVIQNKVIGEQMESQSTNKEAQRQISLKKSTLQEYGQFEKVFFNIDERLSLEEKLINDVKEEQFKLYERKKKEMNEVEFKDEEKQISMYNTQDAVVYEELEKENLNCFILPSTVVAESDSNKPVIMDDVSFPLKKAEVILRRNQHIMFPRRTREYKSEKEMICTYCDMRGHLCQACPNN